MTITPNIDLAKAHTTMATYINLYVFHHAAKSLDSIYFGLWQLPSVVDYLELAGDTSGPHNVKTAFTTAVRNYIDGKKGD